MKHSFKRSLSMMMVIVMLFSLLSGLNIVSAASVNYAYDNVYDVKDSSTVLYENVIKNWGKRGTAATYLSPNAEAFYTNNGTSYADLSALSGAATAADVPASALFASLQELMERNHTPNSENASKAPYHLTDCQGNDSTAISAFYSGDTVGPQWDSGKTWNREHVWPQSKQLSTDSNNDIMSMRPASAANNSSRGNTPYGTSADYYDPNQESNGTYNVRGDVARTILYTYVRWGNSETVIWGTTGVFESAELLLDWMEEDPVDTWELGRNDSVETITGTRNVFVDYPELAFVLFGEEIPSTMTTPSGEAVRDSVTYSITATSSNTDMGTVSVVGKTVNAFPAQGYQVSGYTLISGDATVTQNGNAFTVEATSDCQIQVNFAASEQITVTFMQDGAVAATQTVYDGERVLLPAHQGDAPEGCTFLGWVTAPVSETAEKPATIYKANTTQELSLATTYYALYSYLSENSGATSQIYQKVTTAKDDWSGNYLIVYENGAGSLIYDGSKSDLKTSPNYVSATIVDSAIDAQSTSDKSFTIAKNGTSYTVQSASGYYIGQTKDDNDVKYSKTNKYTNTISINTDGTVNIIASGKPYLRYNASDKMFRYYRSGTYTKQKPICLYELTTGAAVATEVFATNTSAGCVHANITNEPATPATCTENGFTAGVYCNDCKSYISGHEIAPALGHKYESVVTAPTQEEKGYTTHTCSQCGDSYKDSYTDALKDIHTVSFVTPEGVSQIAAMQCGTAGITLPEAAAPAGEQTYTFVGWTAATVEDTEETQVCYKAGTNFKTDADTTLYALYSYTVGGEGGPASFQKVTADPGDWTGTYLIVYEKNGSVLNGSLTALDVAGNFVNLTITDNTIAYEDGKAYTFEIAKDGSNYTIQSASGCYIGSTSTSNKLYTSTSTKYANTITWGSAGPVIKASSGTTLLFYSGGSNSRFRYYGTSQQAIALYALSGGGASGTTYYTTLNGTAAEEIEAIIGDQTYATIQEAVTAYTTGVIVLQKDVEAVTVSKDVVIDLNGCDIGTATATDATLYCLDSQTDDHTVADDVYGKIGTYTGNVVAQNSYLAIAEDNGTSYHKYTLEIVDMTLRAENAGVYYNCKFAGDELVSAQVVSYGVAVSVRGTPVVGAAGCGYSSFTSFQSGENAPSTLLKNILSATNSDYQNNRNAQMLVYGRAYIETADGYIYGDTVSRSFRQQVELADASWASLSAEQQTALTDLYQAFTAVVDTWTVPNTKGNI